MLKITTENSNLIKLELSGGLDAAEMKIGLDQLIEATRDWENGKLIYFIDQLEMPTLSAIVVELGKLPSLFAMARRIEKVAVVADQAWIRTIAEWEGALFPGLEIKAFEHGSEKEARAWLDT